MSTNFYPYASDIEEQVLSALSQVFLEELQTSVPQSDPLWLRTLRVNPLQDDPTLVAPYLAFGPDFLKGQILIEGELSKIYGDVEIGGPIRYLHHYSGVCGTPFVVTREQCLAQINNLTARVTRVLVRHYDLANILVPGALCSPDQSLCIEGANPWLVTEMHAHLQGGEQTWFGKSTLNWRYPVSWYL